MSDEIFRKYNHAIELYDRGDYYDAYNEFDSLGQYKDSYIYMARCKEFMEEYYDEATHLFNEGKYEEAKELFLVIKGFSDAKSMVQRCNDKLEEIRRAKERERRAEEERVALIARREREERERVAREAEARERAEREREAERRRAAEEAARRERERRERRKGAFESFIQYTLIFLPTILVVVLGIILFSNKTQISIKSNYTGWSTGWTFFLVATIPFTIVSMVMRSHRSNKDTGSRVIAIIAVCVSLIASLVGFINAGKLESNFNPTRDVSISLRYKTDTTSYSYYNSEIGFDIVVHSKCKITYLEWDAKFYNGSQRVGWYSIYHNGLLNNGSNLTYVNLQESTSYIYETPDSNFRMEYYILSMEFKYDSTNYKFSNSTRWTYL